MGFGEESVGFWGKLRGFGESEGFWGGLGCFG